MLAFSVSMPVAFSQTIQEIATGAGYQKQSFVNLSAGTESLIANTAWDIAFSVFGQQDAGIFVNESSGSSMGQPLPALELYDALTDNFADQPDPSVLEDYRLYNAEKTWNYGALNENRDPANLGDYGWGVYDPATHQILGRSVYVLKLRNGQYKKIKVESLNGTTYTFRYANLDGTSEVTKTINKADFSGKTLAYYSFTTENTVSVEPASGFDLMYCRYITPLFDPSIQSYIPYAVAGILSGRGVKAAKADGIDPTTVQFANYQDSLSTAIDVVGYDWKAFSGTAWSVDLDRAYFVKTANNRVWKLYFIDFEGSTTGKAIFEKTDLGVVSSVKTPADINVEVLAYPNPVVDQLYVALDIPAEMAQRGSLRVTDMQGRTVVQQTASLRDGFQVLELEAATWNAGTYVLTLDLPETAVFLGKVVKN